MIGKKDSQFQSKFKQTLPFESRLKESKKIMDKCKLRVPVIIEKNSNGSNIGELNQNKFLFQGFYSFGKLLELIKERLAISKEQSLFIFFSNNKLYSPTCTMAQIYEECKDEDGFLYAVYSTENVYG